MAATAASMSPFSAASSGPMQSLRALALRLDAWLGARKRADEDRQALDAMSDRELKDIGIPRASVSPAASGAWMRDMPY
jgi:uncharacterized protein YjiS (DUF1127 family)